MVKNKMVTSDSDDVKCFCGAKMKVAGIGKFPYDCIAAQEFPHAVIYQGCENGHNCWTYKK